MKRCNRILYAYHQLYYLILYSGSLWYISQFVALYSLHFRVLMSVVTNSSFYLFTDQSVGFILLMLLTLG